MSRRRAGTRCCPALSSSSRPPARLSDRGPATATVTSGSSPRQSGLARGGGGPGQGGRGGRAREGWGGRRGRARGDGPAAGFGGADEADEASSRGVPFLNSKPGWAPANDGDGTKSVAVPRGGTAARAGPPRAGSRRCWTLEGETLPAGGTARCGELEGERCGYFCQEGTVRRRAWEAWGGVRSGYVRPQWASLAHGTTRGGGTLSKCACECIVDCRR